MPTSDSAKLTQLLGVYGMGRQVREPAIFKSAAGGDILGGGFWAATFWREVYSLPPQLS